MFFTINGGGAYWQWAYQRIGAGNPEVHLTGDANGDGVSNLLCYAFGLDPLAPWSSTALPAVGQENGSPGRLSITYRRNIAAGTGLTYFPEFSGNLSGWQASGNDPTLVSQSGAWQEWKVVDDQNASTSTRRFGRVRIIYTDTSP